MLLDASASNSHRLLDGNVLGSGSDHETFSIGFAVDHCGRFRIVKWPTVDDEEYLRIYLLHYAAHLLEIRHHRFSGSPVSQPARPSQLELAWTQIMSAPAHVPDVLEGDAVGHREDTLLPQQTDHPHFALPVPAVLTAAFSQRGATLDNDQVGTTAFNAFSDQPVAATRPENRLALGRLCPQAGNDFLAFKSHLVVLPW